MKQLRQNSRIPMADNYVEFPKESYGLNVVETNGITRQMHRCAGYKRTNTILKADTSIPTDFYNGISNASGSFWRTSRANMTTSGISKWLLHKRDHDGYNIM